MKIVAFVPIRLNSKRVKLKNIRKLGGVPLLNHVLETLTLVTEIRQTYIFCSDKKIKDYISPKIFFLEREKFLDGDDVVGDQIYKSFVDKVDADVYLLCHATSPFIKLETITNALSKVISGEYDSAHSVREIRSFGWFRDEPLNFDLTNIPRTQDLEPIFADTSAFFVFTKEVWKTKGRRLGDKIYRQVVGFPEYIDIDSEDDMKIAQLIASKR